MRIVHVTDCYLPRMGGIETQVADLVHHQRAAGHEVHVVTRTADDADQDTRVHRIRAGWTREMLLGSLRTAQTVRDLRPDVVHCHNSVLSPLAVAVASAAADLGYPTAVTVHSLLPAAGPILPLSGLVLGVRGSHVAWSAVSEVAAAPVRRVLGGRTRVDVLPNAVDVDWWREAARARRTTAASEVRVVTVGRLAIRKRPLALVDMMARVRGLVRADVPLRLVVVGDGPQRGRVERRVRELGMSDWVDLPGQLTRDAIRDVLGGGRRLRRARSPRVLRHRSPRGPVRRTSGRCESPRWCRGVRDQRHGRSPGDDRRRHGSCPGAAHRVTFVARRDQGAQQRSRSCLRVE